jgi:hypothetical protein
MNHQDVIRASLIAKIIEHMLDYQKQNQITKQCITNCLYLYRQIRCSSNLNPKVISVFMTSHEPDTETINFFSGHLVITFDNNGKTYIVDPSFEFWSKKNKTYMFTVSELQQNHPYFKKCDRMREIINDFIEFDKLASRINNGECIVGENGEGLYMRQADYVKEKMAVRE